MSESWMRRDLTRFGVEFLCLLVLLSGDPLQAISEAGAARARLEVTAEAPPAEPPLDGESDFDPAASAAAAVETAAGLWGAARETASAAGAGLVGQLEALSILFATSSFSDPQDGADSVPPMPRGFSEPTRPPGIPGLPQSLRAGPKSALDQIPLVPGWNLLSIPEEPADPDPAVVLAPIAGAYNQVFAYDACDPADPWKLFDPTDPGASDLLALDHTMGWWIDATQAVDLPSDGTLPATTSWQLCTGWNLIGFPVGQARHVKNALQSIEGKYVRVFGYEPTDVGDPWEIYDVAVPDWANDLELMLPGRGYWVLVTEDSILEIANQGTEPTVAITAPSDLAVVTEPIDIFGTVQSDVLESWTLEYRLAGESGWIEIASQPYPVTDAKLGSFDPTLLPNGLYELRREATDLQGQVVEETIAVSVDGNMKIGNFSLTYLDLLVSLSGLDLEIRRIYNSRRRAASLDFGHGWVLDIRQGSYRSNRPPGDGWQILNPGGPLGLPCTQVVETKSHRTTVRLSDREVYRFTLRLQDTSSTLGGCFGRAVFEYVDGPLPRSTLEIIGDATVFFANGSDRVVVPDTQELFEPQDVRLTTRDGRIFDLDLEAGVTRVQDLSDNELQITPAAITHSSGRQIGIARDGEGRIVSITDPAGESMSYAYNAAGDLVSFADRSGAISRYSYVDGHLLSEIEDARGVTAIRNEYDDQGRLVRQFDAFGRALLLEHDLEGRRELVTNRLGGTRVLEFDSRGNVVRETDELGNATVHTYDGRDNLLTEIDPLGRTVTRVYSSTNDLTQITDASGNITSFTYNDLGKVLTKTDAKGQVTAHVFDGSGRRIRTTDAAGNISLFGYDSQGNRDTITDSEGNVFRHIHDGFGNLTQLIEPDMSARVFTYDSNGNVLTETRTRTTPSGSETLVRTQIYDELGRQLSVTEFDGTTTHQVYDALGLVIRETDELGQSTEHTYDDGGRLVQTLYPDATVEAQTYDAEGRLLTQTDRAGNTTSAVYDAVGRKTEVIHPDGTIARTVYDAAGQQIEALDELGNRWRFEYDASGRREKVIDPLDGAMVTSYDANGNTIALQDARGAVTTFEYDALNRVTKKIFADGTSQEMAYDTLGRMVTEKDALERQTAFEYDGSGHPAKVIDPLGQETLFTYDELGNQITQTDALGRTTEFEFDTTGQVTRRILPDGSAESFLFNGDGSLARQTDSLGRVTAWEYDAAKRPVRRLNADGTEVLMAYTASGEFVRVTDLRGTTIYQYDDRDRLIEMRYPDGRRLSYAYDAAGNRNQMTAQVGLGSLTTAYTYDALNRLSTVTDSDGDTYSYAYNGNGSRTSLVYPNGAHTTTEFDTLNRLTHLQTEDGAGQIAQAYTLELDANGRRSRIDEHGGTSRSYTYDFLDRLLEDSEVDGVGALLSRREYVYDAVGNRLSESITAGDGSIELRLSTYDTRDRLLSADSSGYTWDNNGNLVQRSGSAAASFVWNSQDQLTLVTLEDGSEIRTLYDFEGNRIQTAVTDAGGVTSVVDYLVDSNGPLSHVVVESQGNTSVLAHYVRGGDGLLAVQRPASGQKRFYHADGLGSIRLLTDENAQSTDRYSYTAFGELLKHFGNDPNPYQFAGEPFDLNIGFYYNRARWLDVGTGRFVSIDPFPGNATEPITLHRYLYAHNDPANVIDPTGEQGILQFSLGQVIVTLLAGLALLSVFAVRASVSGHLVPVRGLPTKIDVVGAFAAMTALFASEITRLQRKVKKWKKRRPAKHYLLFHYSTLERAESIYYKRKINVTENGTFGRAAYATNIPPVVIDTVVTRTDLIKRVFGDKNLVEDYLRTTGWVSFFGKKKTWKGRTAIFYALATPPQLSVKIAPIDWGETLLPEDD
ncbi:MAG: hypothetical protein GY722_05105 [bacterium]|nr:hypothetical protein [bacterium]